MNNLLHSVRKSKSILLISNLLPPSQVWNEFLPICWQFFSCKSIHNLILIWLSSDRKCAEQDSMLSLSLLPIQWAYAIYLFNINGKAAFNLRLFFLFCSTCKLFDATIFQQNFATIKNPIKLQTDSIFQLQEELWWRYNKLKRKLRRKKSQQKLRWMRQLDENFIMLMSIRNNKKKLSYSTLIAVKSLLVNFSVNSFRIRFLLAFN